MIFFPIWGTEAIFRFFAEGMRILWSLEKVIVLWQIKYMGIKYILWV